MSPPQYLTPSYVSDVHVFIVHLVALCRECCRGELQHIDERAYPTEDGGGWLFVVAAWSTVDTHRGSIQARQCHHICGYSCEFLATFAAEVFLQGWLGGTKAVVLLCCKGLIFTRLSGWH